MPNTVRGEITLILNGMKYILRPTFEALACIEAHIGKSIFTLLSQFSEKGVTLNEQIQIIKIGSEASGTKITMTDKEIGELIVRGSIISVINSVCAFLQKGLGL